MSEKKTIDSFLLKAKIAIENGMSNAEIAGIMKEFGYTSEKMAEGNTLLIKANELNIKQKKEYGEQYAATDAVNNRYNQINTSYMKHIKLARLVFKDERDKFKGLELSGERKRSLSGWISQAKQFYTGMLSEEGNITGISKYGITKEKLEAGLTAVEELESLKVKQEKESGEAQQATVERDNCFDELNEWIGEFRTVARIALEDKPQYLEMIGIKA